MDRLNQKLFWMISILFFLGLILFIGNSFLVKPKTIEITPPPKETQLVEKEQSIKIILVGDIMLDRGVKYMVGKEGAGDFRFPFLKIADYLREADIVLGNLEGVISDKGTKVGSIYSFRIKPEAIEGLTFAGFNVLSLANNHALDYTREALEDCLAKLSNAQIGYVGVGFNEKEAYSPFIKEINGSVKASTEQFGPEQFGPELTAKGLTTEELSRMSSPAVRVAFLAYTNLGPETWRAAEENSGIAWISENNFEKIKKDIENTKSQADILIVSLHAGEEYVQKPTQFQVEFSKMAIEAGADLVVGHHPHIVQESEKYKDKWIFYSLGNFIFDQSFSEETMKGQILEVLIENPEGPRPLSPSSRLSNPPFLKTKQDEVNLVTSIEGGAYGAGKKIKEVIVREVKINNFFQPEILE